MRLDPEIQARVDAVRAARTEGTAGPRNDRPKLFELTERQRQILRLAADGATNPEIAQELWVSENTVKTTMRRILATLEARSRAHAVAIAYDRGILRPAETDGTIDP